MYMHLSPAWVVSWPGCIASDTVDDPTIHCRTELIHVHAEVECYTLGADPDIIPRFTYEIQAPNVTLPWRRDCDVTDESQTYKIADLFIPQLLDIKLSIYMVKNNSITELKSGIGRW